MKTCSAAGCANNLYAKNLCNKHYQRARKGLPLSYSRKSSKSCEIPGCEKGRGHLRRGMCQMHYARWKNTGSPELKVKSVLCVVGGCGKPSRTKEMCTTHYERQRRSGTTDAPRRLAEGAYQWMGGRVRNGQGYITILVDRGHWLRPYANSNGRMLEHRFVMAEKLHRALLSSEYVHHKNGDKEDNRLDNLELWSKSHPAGQRVEDKVEWALEFIKTYRPEVLK